MSASRVHLALMTIIGSAPTLIWSYRWTAGGSVPPWGLVTLPFSWFLLLMVYVNLRTGENDPGGDESDFDLY